ncbi:polysaccharide deacetylase family protein [Pseudomonas typographi]|uniref:polysaccharide deacetylase family protein n=1 Tax=Pseudomonas typographi TaxID=2715964 RepID=UPI0016858E4F|nr:polysaccharide deacetylase family protein [Pseudomonas typographi]MBD1550804.1 polysaccharide deacetylase family protein [Pseudomonas typographi]
MRVALFLITALLAFAHAVAAPVATLDRSVWPESIDSPVLFDVASRAQILGFAHELALTEALDEGALASRLGLRQIDMEAISSLRGRLWQRLWENFDAAQQSCEQDASFCYAVDDVDSLKAEASQFVVADDSFYAKWRDPGRAFNRTYLDELLRMAALFPTVSSEIAKFSANEHNGDELNDRVFLLTFDSGPTLAGGNTDWVTDYLRRQKMTATFFVLGNSLQLRRDNAPQGDLEQLYGQQCVGVQGWEYRSHAQWRDWQDSIQRSVALVQAQVPGSFVAQFRPPYGQRRADSGEFFEQQHLAVVLWDIDAQDTNTQVPAELLVDRVLSLMLLWRKGVIAFHDAQSKVKTALPVLLQRTAQSGIAWEDCHAFAR